MKITMLVVIFCATILIGGSALETAITHRLVKTNAELRQENAQLKTALEDMSAADARLKAADLVLKGNCSKLQQANENLSIVARLSSDQLRSDIATFRRLRREGCR